MSVTVGKPAPAFRLPDQDGTPFDSKSLKGQWTALYFYPKDDTPGCTTEACEFTESIAAFRGLDAQVIGVSPDSPERHRKFIDKHALDIRLLSDPDHAVLAKYGAWGVKKMYGKEHEGVIRSTVLIDPRGKVAHHWPKVKAAGHALEVREMLESLKNQ